VRPVLARLRSQAKDITEQETMMPRQVKINAFIQAQITKLMLEGAYSCAELAEMTGAHYVTILQYTRELRRAGAAHICRYEPDQLGREAVKIYKIGGGKDAKRKKLTGAQRQARCREKIARQREDAVIMGRGTYAKSANGRLCFVSTESATQPTAA